MCGRYTLSRREADQLAFELGIPVEQLADYEPRYNIAPGQRQWIVRMEYEDREALQARWGLINRWAKDRNTGYKQINAPAPRPCMDDQGSVTRSRSDAVSCQPTASTSGPARRQPDSRSGSTGQTMA